MKPSLTFTALAGVAAVGTYLAINATTTPETASTVPPGAQGSEASKGAELYQSFCAACHGVNLEGQENWRQRNAQGRLPAPPHDETGHTWHHNRENLFNLTKYGVAAVIGDPSYPSDMPGFSGVLNDTQITAVLDYIQSTWPDDIRKPYEEREAGQ